MPVASGQILVDGVDHSGHGARNSAAFRRAVQMVFQDPHASLDPRMTVGQTLAEAVAMRPGRGGSRTERRREVERLLDLVHIPKEYAGRHPHAFSGGQKQRIAIARALAVGARLVIHDEVTSALDVSVQASILNLLKDLQRELGLSYVFISHDLSAVRAVSDAVVVMYLGRVVEEADAVQLFGQSAHPYTRALVASIPTLADARRPAQLVGEIPDPRHPPAGCRFHTRCPVGPLFRPERTECVTADPALDAGARLHRSACHFAPHREGADRPAAVSTHGNTLA